MPTALLLDLDGLLADSNAAHAEALTRAARDIGHPAPRAAFDRVIGMGTDLLVAEVLGEDVEAAHGDAFRDAAGRHFRAIAAETSLALFDGAEALIHAAHARGLTTALATSSSEDDLDALFESTGTDLRPLVGAVTSASDADTSKPAPDIVEAAAEALGVPVTDCVLVGDTVYDGEAARRAGAAFVGVASWVWTARDLREAGAQAVYPTTRALADRLGEALDTA